MNSREVYMTVLTTESYIPGLIALKKSLLKTNTSHKLIILVPSNKKNEFNKILKAKNILDENCGLLSKPPVRSKYFSRLPKNYYWWNYFFKLASTSCIEFKKIVLLDLDLYIRKNIDDLFEHPNFSAAICGRAVHKDWVTLNSGLMVIEPSKKLYLDLIKCIEKVTRRGAEFGDQSVFIEYCKNWETKNDLLLPDTYNCYYRYIYDVAKYYKIKTKDIKVIHFYGPIKPWDKSFLQIVLHIGKTLLKLKFTQAIIFIKYIWLTHS